MNCARELMVARIVEILDEQTRTNEIATLVSAPVPDKAVVLDVLVVEQKHRACNLLVDMAPPSADPERVRDREHLLDEALRTDLLAIALWWGASALRAPHHADGERIAGVVLRLLGAIPAVTAPPYVPLEVPWLRRTPGPCEVDPHALAHPVEGRRGVLWLLSQDGGARRGPLGAAVVELFVDDGHVFSATHKNPATGAPMLLDHLVLDGCRWLPLTPDLLPAFLLRPEPAVDPTGAPIVHVPTETAIHALALVGLRFPEEVPNATEAVEHVIRERDHHAKRVGELLQAATWERARVRALSKLVPEVRCVLCGWSGWPYACPVHPEGLLLCPTCMLPCYGAGHPAPAWLLDWLFGEVADQSQRALQAEGGDAATHWKRVSVVAEAIVASGAAAGDEAEHVAAHRASIVAAMLGGDMERAAALVQRYKDAATTPPRLLRDLHFLGAAIEAGKVPEAPDVATRRGIWPCCGQPACVCGIGWLATMTPAAASSGTSTTPATETRAGTAEADA